MPAIRFDSVSFHYDDPYCSVFEGLSLVIDSSWRTALVGRNGRGKTTLLRLLAGALAPAYGTVWWPPRVAHARAHQIPRWQRGDLRDHLRDEGIDEPLNYIDLMSREQIEEVVLDFEPSMVFVEHDRVFVEAVATRVIDLGRWWE